MLLMKKVCADGLHNSICKSGSGKKSVGIYWILLSAVAQSRAKKNRKKYYGNLVVSYHAKDFEEETSRYIEVYRDKEMAALFVSESDFEIYGL